MQLSNSFEDDNERSSKRHNFGAPPCAESRLEHRLPHSVCSIPISRAIFMVDPSTGPLTRSNPTSTPTKQQPSKPTTRSIGLSNVRLIITGLIVFIGVTWILGQTSSLGQAVKGYLPHLVQDKMSGSGKKTVGYFVSRLRSLMKR